MQEENPHFFYVMDLDEHQRLRNIRHGDFMRVFNMCIYKSWTGEQFERRWQEMVERFEVNDNEWLQSIYNDYMRDTFFAGMSTTQRSESINSFFDKYVGRKTTLKEFVDQYKVGLEDRLEVVEFKHQIIK
ncbi:hypothetical protein CFOL_v3_21795 [Cephalotus follicularis]|uniref:Protein FAR1-RELATED SEQUENCE n=1 Tax=Cephalotus follicularis TaxID=3775 RepID=A0A1Q3CDR2_CEPFO|nr:hypothetical protein CFOL_v3_21795 [Cephalotus follicularis]